MTAIQENRVDLSAEADVAIVKILFLLLQHIRQFVYLLLQHDYFLAKVGIVVPSHVAHTARVH